MKLQLIFSIAETIKLLFLRSQQYGKRRNRNVQLYRRLAPISFLTISDLSLQKTEKNLLQSKKLLSRDTVTSIRSTVNQSKPEA